MVRPWSPVWVVAATATSSTRSAGSAGLRRSSSRMQRDDQVVRAGLGVHALRRRPCRTACGRRRRKRRRGNYRATVLLQVRAGPGRPAPPMLLASNLGRAAGGRVPGRHQSAAAPQPTSVEAVAHQRPAATARCPRALRRTTRRTPGWAMRPLGDQADQLGAQTLPALRLRESVADLGGPGRVGTALPAGVTDDLPGRAKTATRTRSASSRLACSASIRRPSSVSACGQPGAGSTPLNSHRRRVAAPGRRRPAPAAAGRRGLTSGGQRILAAEGARTRAGGGQAICHVRAPRPVSTSLDRRRGEGSSGGSQHRRRTESGASRFSTGSPCSSAMAATASGPRPGARRPPGPVRATPGPAAASRWGRWRRQLLLAAARTRPRLPPTSRSECRRCPLAVERCHGRQVRGRCRLGQCRVHQRGIGQYPPGATSRRRAIVVPGLPQRADDRELPAAADPVQARRAPPRLERGSGAGAATIAANSCRAHSSLPCSASTGARASRSSTRTSTSSAA